MLWREFGTFPLPSHSAPGPPCCSNARDSFELVEKKKKNGVGEEKRTCSKGSEGLDDLALSADH